ncbi:hypothetical protein [Bacteroides sp.]|uniref:hypothetical protein n=1 Tax=Bacteroides sp. TaxID=29523 RepID=UPI00262259F5|nr:hypothetical protein [Bacteroides sp.]
MIDIKDTFGNVRFSTEINEGSKRKFLLMKEDYITLKFSLEEPVNFKLGDHVDDPRFGLFELCDLYKPNYNSSTGGYDYELRMDAYYWKWKNKLFKYMPEAARQEASWNLTATLEVHADAFLRGLAALGYTYKGTPFECSIDKSVNSSAKLVSYDNMNMLDALFKMAETWECECWVTENVIHFGRCEYHTAVDLEMDANVAEMTASNSQGTYATRIYAFGSTRNLPAGYRPVAEEAAVNGVVQKRLMLPADTPFIDAYPKLLAEEIIESVVVFDDVYPHNEGTMSDITTKEYTDSIENADGTVTKEKWNAFRFRDAGLTFSKDYILPGEELHIIFQSGVLNGMDFAVRFDPDNKDKQLWEILRNEDYGRKLPDEVLAPKNGDKYVLYGWDATRIDALGLVAAAEQELKTRAIAYTEKVKIDPSTYSVKMISNSIYSADGVNKLLEIGDRVKLINKAYWKEGRQSRVIGYEYNLDFPFDSPLYTVGETAPYSKIGELEGKVESLTYKGQSYSGSTGRGVYLIRTNDSTPATDSNAYSARRVLKQFLSKDREDTAQELIKFLRGLLVGENSSGITILEDGTSQVVIDRLFVKIKAVFDELEVKKRTYVGGEQILSPAGMKCIKVEETTDAYRCYFKVKEDGVEIKNQFTPGTLAISQECNVKVGVSHNVGNRYYWRLVTAVGSDYIELSKTKCDPNIENDIPIAGDDIVGLGHKTDITRQGAIILSSVNEVAPSILMYQGIDSFSLAGKDVIGFDFDKSTGKARMRVYGDTYIGAKDRNSYMEFTKDGLEVKAKKIFLGTGDMDEILSDLNQSVSNINSQLDQSFQVWQGETSDTPTLTNKPASEWKTDADKSLHVDDFYITTEGLCYQFQQVGSVYQWKPVTDKYLIAYVQQIGEKKRVFVTQPANAVAYDIGDCWVNANYTDGSGKVLYNNDRLVCVTTKVAGVPFSISHWKKDSKYTDDTKAEEAFDYTDTKAIELRAYADNSAKAKADAAAILAKAYADGIVTESEAAAIDAANRYADAQDELFRVVAEAYADGIVTEEEKRAIADAKAKADAAKKAAQDYADKMDAETATKLLKTGINIENNTITATADTFTVQGRDGKKYAVFEVDSATGLPMMKADYIKVTSMLMAKAIMAGGLNIGDKFLVTIGPDGKASVKLTGNIIAESGMIAGMKVSGNSLTNEGFNNDSCVILRNDNTGCFAGIGGNTLPASSGMRAAARFENNDNSFFNSVNTAMVLSAKNGNTNHAIDILGGDISGFSTATKIISSSATLNRRDASTYIAINPGGTDITLTFPTMEMHDDGIIIRIKRLGDGKVYLRAGNSKHRVVSGTSYTDVISGSFMCYDGNYYQTGTTPHQLRVNEVLEYQYVRDLIYPKDNPTYKGCWMQMQRTSY